MAMQWLVMYAIASLAKCGVLCPKEVMLLHLWEWICTSLSIYWKQLHLCKLVRQNQVAYLLEDGVHVRLLGYDWTGSLLPGSHVLSKSSHATWLSYKNGRKLLHWPSNSTQTSYIEHSWKQHQSLPCKSFMQIGDDCSTYLTCMKQDLSCRTILHW